MYKLFIFIVIPVFIFVIKSQDTAITLVRPYCMGCMCHVLTNCSQNYTSKGWNNTDLLGYMRISQPYWKDAGSETIGGLNLTFEECARNKKCATLAVQNYMQRYQDDCNGDDKIDCIDFFRIHVLGPKSCSGNISEEHVNEFEKCFACQYGTFLDFDDY